MQRRYSQKYRVFSLRIFHYSQRFGQKPLRKFLLCGEPGTGKTSICYDIAKGISERYTYSICNRF